METKTISKNYTTLPEKAVVDKVSSSLLLRGITMHYAENKFEGLKLLKELIPPGAEVMTGGSTTLEQIGFKDYLKSAGISGEI
ncbi:MAG: LUD domain-containing protein [Bacteroidetes bacterium]|nr:LUD domain-containing protein [Bacteroidota bacterium]